MKQFEIRTKDLKRVEGVQGFPYPKWFRGAMAKMGKVIVEHEWETEAEADKARLD